MSVSLPPDYPLVKADFSLMEQVLVNLLLNACVHTPEGTSVTLQGGADPVRGQVWLDIHDMGPGIPPERAETIFERFRTTRPGGLGLGLPIVRGFMEAQRGAVSLVPVSAGTCFRLVLPLVEHDSVLKSNSSCLMSNFPADILIIDDERQIRRLLNLTLTGAGYHVRECENGQLGLSETALKRPDAIILDPGGFRTLTAWKC